MKRYARAAVVLLAVMVVGSVGWGQDQAKAPESKQAETKRAPNTPNYFRVEVVLREYDASKIVNTRKYVFVVEENGGAGTLRLGDRVPIATGSFSAGAGSESNRLVNTQFQYMDIGLNIECRVASRPQWVGPISLYVNVDQSSILSRDKDLGQPIIRHMRTDGTTFVELNKPMLVTSVEDPSAPNRKYTIEATMTKLNP